MEELASSGLSSVTPATHDDNKEDEPITSVYDESDDDVTNETIIQTINPPDTGFEVTNDILSIY